MTTLATRPSILPGMATQELRQDPIRYGPLNAGLVDSDLLDGED